MERPKRAATRVTDFRKFHLSGNLDEEVQGLVDSRVNLFEMATAELKQKLEQEREASRKIQEDAERAEIQHQIEVERMKQEQWQTAINKLKKAKEHASQEHTKCLEQMDQLAESTMDQTATTTLGWLKQQMGKTSTDQASAPPLTEEQQQIRARELEREAALKELKKQQEELNKKIQELQEDSSPSEDPSQGNPGRSQGISQGLHEVLLQQLKTALAGNKEEDPNKVLLKALITQQNKTTGQGGTTTLKPSILNKLVAGDGNTMAEWLATLNKQEEGEFEIPKFPMINDDELPTKQVKVKSGILDKATTNIQHKQVWPQQNLGEDWADEEVEFKQMRFEHLVAGETRTIETCTDPTEILGRLRLLRQLAYLKLRGYEWHVIRKMYAAILTSIETREYSWESNFNRFETIPYRRAAMDSRPHNENRHEVKEGRKRFCRDYNQEGCPKNSPHTVWIGNGPSAVKRLVYHYCAACLIRDKQHREHPEGHQDCPHKD